MMHFISLKVKDLLKGFCIVVSCCRNMLQHASACVHLSNVAIDCNHMQPRSGGSMWSRLWQLTFFLRCGAEGMDSPYLKQAEIVRRRSRQLNWQQTLVHFQGF